MQSPPRCAAHQPVAPRIAPTDGTPKPEINHECAHHNIRLCKHLWAGHILSDAAQQQ
jgi:hypothetical protein